MTTTNNTAPFLRSSWQFPDDNPQALSVQVDRAYVAIANNVNARTIGVFPDNIPIGTGERWVLSGQSHAGQRKVFTFTATGNIAHGLDVSTISYFTNCFGSFTDGTNYYGLIFAGSTTIAGQISFYLTPTNIVVAAGAGAPAITSGIVCLEWISQV
jgi:hypothetical protein